MKISKNLRKFILPSFGRGMGVGALVLLLCALCVSSCGDDDDTNPYLKMGSDSRPAWILPQNIYQEFEFTMGVQVTLQDELVAFASEEDLMCATVNGEIRALTSLQYTGGEPYFSLIIAGNSNSGSVTLQYYCAQLKRIFTFPDWMPFSPGISPTQDGKPYVVEFIPVND